MQIEINNETAALQAAQAAGFANVEAYVNCLIKRDSDLQALKEGIADAEAGNVRDFNEFAKEFRASRGFAPSPKS